ncbi:hypothetical protein B0T10DRAFT_477984 [Thelonectria olida]|uniref:Secreted protein n=1 Tax=Thelonectria olida TaxID=1576542 RepID=A0A9P8WFE5_9HYPO|nr:hypothetical protein B0T10DRAFT_477984 [Thelonectria olida]
MAILILAALTNTSQSVRARERLAGRGTLYAHGLSTSRDQGGHWLTAAWICHRFQGVSSQVLRTLLSRLLGRSLLVSGLLFLEFR